MTRYILFHFLFFLGISLVQAQSWKPSAMHGGGYVTGIEGHPTDANTVFARIDVGGIYKSSNQGDDWTSITKSIPLSSQRHFQVRSMAIDDTNADNIYFVAGNAAYSDESSFWWTADGGTIWNRGVMPTQTNGNHFGRSGGELLVIDPINPNQLYLAGMGYYDNGAWQGTGGLFTSTDKGATWTKLDGTQFDTTWFHDMKFNPHDSNKLLLSASSFQESWMTGATSNEGLWEYDITAGTFTQLRTDNTFEVAFDAVDVNKRIAIWEDGIYISSDAGGSWVFTQPFGYNYRYFVTPHPTNAGHWFFGYWKNIFDNGIIETTDSGFTFEEIKYNGGTNNSKLTYPAYTATNYQPSFANASSCLSFSPADPTVVYTGDWYGVWRSTNAGTNLSNGNASNVDNSNWSWDWTSQGIHNLVQLRVSKHPTTPGLFFNCVADIGYYKATNYGATMEHKTATPISSTYKIAFEQNNPNTGYAVGKQFNNKGRIVKTTNGGTDWFEAVSGGQFTESYFETQGSSAITDIQIAGNATESLIVGIEKGNMPSQIYRSDDQGLSFYPWDTGISGIGLYKVWTSTDHLMRSADGLTFYTWRNDQFYKREINDATWQLLTPPAGVGKWIAQVITHPTEANTLYVSQYSFGTFKSTDGGTTWTNLPIAGVANGELAISPDGQKLVVLDRDNFGSDRAQQFFLTLDEGVNWYTISTECLLTPARGLTFLDDEKLIAWTEGTGSHIFDFGENQTNQTGELFDYISNTITNAPGSSGDDYIKPTSTEMAIWEQVLENLWEGNIATSATLAGLLNYDVVSFTDNSGELYYILEAQEVNGNYWGTYVYNPASCQSNLVIQAPHPKNDTNTGLEGIYVFEEVGAAFYMVSGTHRCNNSEASSCSGTTSTCGGGAFRISDMAHTATSMFQVSTEFLLNRNPDIYFLQFHGYGSASSLDAILSNGTTFAPAVDVLSQFGQALLAVEPSLTYGIAHLDTSLPLKGTTNTQGRLVNQSVDPCGTAATQNVGRFFHIEQALTPLRVNSAGWEIMATAVDNFFRNINITGSALETGYYRTKDTMTVSVPLVPLSAVQLKAGDCIDLQPNFEVPLGSDCLIETNTCLGQ